MLMDYNDKVSGIHYDTNLLIERYLCAGELERG